MISLVCTKCGTSLRVDDGFAGGVCRCSACGTIQTVPTRNAATRGGSNLTSASVSGQSIYERRGLGEPEPSRPSKGKTPKNDLEALSQVVSSSGLVGSGLLGQSRGRTGGSPARTSRGPLIAGVAVAGVAVVGVVAWIALRNDPPADTNRPAVTPSNDGDRPSTPAPPQRAKGPAFGPIALDANGTVIYLLDRGDATRAYTAPLQRAVLQSVRSLGEKRKFQVRYWTADGESPAFPAAPAEATPATLAKLTTWMADVAGSGATEGLDTLVMALAVKPAEVVLVTGKAWQLDESFANEAIAKLKVAPGVRIHAVALGSSGGNDALARIAARTGGKSIELDEGSLATLGN